MDGGGLLSQLASDGGCGRSVGEAGRGPPGRLREGPPRAAGRSVEGHRAALLSALRLGRSGFVLLWWVPLHP